MNKAPEIQKTQEHDHSQPNKVKKWAGHLALAGLSMLGPLDLAASDAVVARSYAAVQQHVRPTDNKTLDRLLDDALIAGVITGQAAGLGMAVKRGKGLENATKEYGEYLEAKRAKMRTPRRWLSKGLNSPLTALNYVGNKVRNVGERMDHRKSRAARVAGKLIAETGWNNAVGTTNVVLDQVKAGKPPRFRDTVRYGAEVAVPWVFGAEAVRAIDLIPGVRDVLAKVGHGFLEATTLNTHAISSGDVVLGGLTLVLGISGINIDRYRRGLHNPNETNSVEPLEPQPSDPSVFSESQPLV